MQELISFLLCFGYNFLNRARPCNADDVHSTYLFHNISHCKHRELEKILHEQQWDCNLTPSQSECLQKFPLDWISAAVDTSVSLSYNYVVKYITKTHIFLPLTNGRLFEAPKQGILHCCSVVLNIVSYKIKITVKNCMVLFN